MVSLLLCTHSLVITHIQGPQLKSEGKSADAERDGRFKRAVRHAVLHDYMLKWDELQQVPFTINVLHSNGSVDICPATVYFTTLWGDFVEHCLQNLIKQQG